MTAKEILAEIKPLGSDSYKKIIMKHGAAEPCYGVKIDALKKIQKRVKKDYQLALDLYDTGVYDARYLAGLIADDAQMTKKDLQRWIDTACEPLVRYTVGATAAASPQAWAIALEWIDAKKEIVAAGGWATLSGYVAITPDAKLDTAALKQLLQRVQKEIHSAPDMVKNQMNGFLIAAGCYVPALTKFAKEVGMKVGPVEIDVGDTACKIPFAPEYIEKVEKRGSIGKKRDTAKC